MSSRELDRGKAESELRGTTLRVYWELFRRNQPMGVREIQRALRLSSPSTSLHHLEKLRRLGLVTKDPQGQYLLAEEIKVGVLRQFVRFGTLILPRHLFYAAFFWAALTLYVIESHMKGFQPDVAAVILIACAVAATTYEAARTWREKLF